MNFDRDFIKAKSVFITFVVRKKRREVNRPLARKVTFFICKYKKRNNSNLLNKVNYSTLCCIVL